MQSPTAIASDLNKGLLKEPRIHSRFIEMAEAIIELRFHQDNIRNFIPCKLNNFFVIELSKQIFFGVLCLFFY